MFQLKMKPDKLLTLGMTEQLNLEEILQLCSGEYSMPLCPQTVPMLAN